MSGVTLTQLFNEFRGQLSDKWSVYSSEYDRILPAYRDLPVNLLQIGMENGNSLEIWARYFKNAQKLVGCDIEPGCAKFHSEDPHFSVVIGDATLASTQANILNISDHFDIIVDGGSQSSGEIARTFARYFPFLRDGGVYIAEDLLRSYRKEFEGGLFAPFSSISFFKRLADVVNVEHWGMNVAPIDTLTGFLATYGFQMDAESLLHIHSVTFSNSMCSIFKADPKHNHQRSRIWSMPRADALADQAGPPEDPLSPLDKMERPALLAHLAGLKRELDSANEQLAGITSSRAWQAALLLRRWNGLIHSPEGLTLTGRKLLLKATQYPRAMKATRVQNGLIRRMYSPETRKLILFLVPGYDVVNGGIMSIVSIAQVSREIESEHGAQVIVTTMPKHLLLTRYSKFPNALDIFRFDQLFSYFHKLDELILHIPEYHVPEFPALLTAKQKRYLRAIPHLQFNVLIQNIWLAPSRKAIDDLRQLTNDITATTAHRKYCTPELRDRYSIPLHHLSVDFRTQYYYRSYETKEDLMVVSHDKNANKTAILERVASEHPNIRLHPIENTPYEDYKKLISRAKWVITFGEGLDSYFIEGIRSGAISFAVYNPNFFSDHFLNLPNVYDSYEAMLRDLPSAIRRLDNPSAFRELSDTLIERDKLEYNAEAYKENVRRFYRKDYRLP